MRQRLALAAGGALVTATSPVPLEWTAMGFVGPVLLFTAVEGHGGVASIRNAFASGWLFSTIVNAIALHWVVGLLEDFGGFPTIAAIPTGMLLWCAQGIPYGLGAAAAVALVRRNGTSRTPRLGLWWILPCTLTVATSLAPNLFPWRLGHSQLGWLPYVQIAELGGEPLTDLTVGLVAGGIYEAMRRRRWRDRGLAAAVAMVAFAAPPLWGAQRIDAVEAQRRQAPTHRVGIVQPNVGIHEKRDPRGAPIHLRDLQRMSRNLEELGADVVIWPESAYPYGIGRRQLEDGAGPRSVRGSEITGPLLFGALTIGDPKPGDLFTRAPRYNSVVAMNPVGRFVGISDKVELLAFGEYTPLWDFLPFLQEHFPRGLTPGEAPKVLELDGVRFGVLNCYEDVLPRHARWVAQHQPDLLVNVTNDAWFGDTTEPHLHHMVARMRAIETRRDLVRAVNTGVSAFTTATGFDEVATPTWVRRSFVADVRLLAGETLWTRLGDWPTATMAGLLLGAAGARRHRKR